MVISDIQSLSLSSRSEVSKVKVPISKAGGPEFSSGSGTGRRCCLNTQQDRISPTGRSEAAPDTSMLLLGVNDAMLNVYAWEVQKTQASLGSVGSVRRLAFHCHSTCCQLGHHRVFKVEELLLESLNNFCRK